MIEVLTVTLYQKVVNDEMLLHQALFLGTWLGTHALTMSQDVPDIHGDRADFASVDRGDVIFLKVCF